MSDELHNARTEYGIGPVCPDCRGIQGAHSGECYRKQLADALKRAEAAESKLATGAADVAELTAKNLELTTERDRLQSKIALVTKVLKAQLAYIRNPSEENTRDLDEARGIINDHLAAVERGGT